MKKFFVIATIALLAAVFVFFYPSKEVGEVGVVEKPVEAEESVSFEILVAASPVSAYAVELTIRTNIPLPIEVMASISIKDQAPTDTYIGVSQRIRLTSREQTVTLDGEGANLPAGEYTAEVTFYPRWGAESGSQEAKEIEEEIIGEADIRLAGSGESKSQADQRNVAQMWVMENVIFRTPWSESQFVQRLGRFSKSEADLNFHDAYYFPEADMTIIVNRLKNSVTVWRMGRATK